MQVNLEFIQKVFKMYGNIQIDMYIYTKLTLYNLSESIIMEG